MLILEGIESSQNESRSLSKVAGFGFNLPSTSTGLRSINLTMVWVGLVWQVSTWQHTRHELTCNDNWIPPMHQREVATSNTTSDGVYSTSVTS